MAREYRFTVVPKASAWEARAAGSVLAALGIQDRDTFLRKYVTTVGRRIYVPFTVGVAQEGWSLLAQLAVVAHECTHLEQEDRDGWWYSWNYLTNTRKRAAYEVQGYRTTMEVEWTLTGETGWDPEGLRTYGCSAQDVLWARSELERVWSELTRVGPQMRAANTVINEYKIWYGL